MSFASTHNDYLDPDKFEDSKRIGTAKPIKSRKFVQLTKRTEDPKLAWLRNQLDKAGIRNRIQGASWHAPILQVMERDLESAWEILSPVDDVPDDDPRFI